MGVQELLSLILDTVRARLRNGEFTERALARRVGVSQAHLHNVLKGARALTPAQADRICGELGISVLVLADRRARDKAA